MNTTFSARLKHLRLLKNKKQSDCAAEFHVTPVAYGAWERGEREPSIDKIVQICRYFNTSADWLLGVEVDEAKQKRELEQFRSELAEYHDLKDKLKGLVGGL